MGICPNRLVPLHSNRQGYRALVRTVIRCSGHFNSDRAYSSLHGFDQIPSRAIKDYSVKPLREPVKYVICLSKARGNSGFPMKACEIG